MIILIDPEAGKKATIMPEFIFYDATLACINYLQLQDEVQQAESENTRLASQLSKPAYERLKSALDELINKLESSSAISVIDDEATIKYTAPLSNLLKIIVHPRIKKEHDLVKEISQYLIKLNHLIRKKFEFKSLRKRMLNALNAGLYDSYNYLGYAAIELNDLHLAEASFIVALDRLKDIPNYDHENTNIIKTVCNIGLAVVFMQKGWVLQTQHYMRLILQLIADNPNVLATRYAKYINSILADLRNDCFKRNDYQETVLWLKQIVYINTSARKVISNFLINKSSAVIKQTEYKLNFNSQAALNDCSKRILEAEKLIVFAKTKHVEKIQSLFPGKEKYPWLSIDKNNIHIIEKNRDILNDLKLILNAKSLEYNLHDNLILIDAITVNKHQLKDIGISISAYYKKRKQQIELQKQKHDKIELAKVVPPIISSPPVEQGNTNLDQQLNEQATVLQFRDDTKVKKPKRWQQLDAVQTSISNEQRKPISIKYMWPNMLDATKPYVYDKEDASCPVIIMRDNYTPAGVWNGYLDEEALQGLDAGTKKQIQEVFRGGKIIQEVGQGIKRIKPKWQIGSRPCLFKIKMKGVNGLGDTRINGYLEATITDEQGRQRNLVKFADLETNYHNRLKR